MFWLLRWTVERSVDTTIRIEPKTSVQVVVMRFAPRRFAGDLDR